MQGIWLGVPRTVYILLIYDWIPLEKCPCAQSLHPDPHQTRLHLHPLFGAPLFQIVCVHVCSLSLWSLSSLVFM